jgi:hypothetical protein
VLASADVANAERSTELFIMPRLIYRFSFELGMKFISLIQKKQQAYISHAVTDVEKSRQLHAQPLAYCNVLWTGCRSADLLYW